MDHNTLVYTGVGIFVFILCVLYAVGLVAIFHAVERAIIGAIPNGRGKHRRTGVLAR